ncbi:hypothetical protein BG844_37845 [Couchioplanes caeruleus subsp. caeruleus]|uniref:Uncharacterized protein n=1 Tax=Couchioplanes caeruleus subsp. caeruleus TaxID=56427 RepID=A0A1K0GEY4_9ACTN|nr:hypothetical protein BG844_37845 [Couchioplanes caeruleus subsp. caeruleus]
MTSLIAFRSRATEPLRAVMWHAARKQWIYAPALAAGLLFDDSYADESTSVDRAAAEDLAREQLHTELPSPERLEAMCEEGARMGWSYGPPRE